jgi:Zn-dependent protease
MTVHNADDGLLPFNTLKDNKKRTELFTTADVLQEIEKQQSHRKNWAKNLFILLISLFIFIKLGLLKSRSTDIAIIVVVLLVHEAGHFIGMRLFGYKNVQMFFIPFFGAAVSGRSQNVSSWKKALVCLMGPVPGIFLGIILGVVYVITRITICQQLAMMFIIINVFNLLPFFPLDGGRFLQEVLLSRNRYIELIFRLLASLSLIAVGLVIQGWILAVFGLVGLVTVGIPFKMAGIAKELRCLPFMPEPAYAEVHSEEKSEPQNIPLKTAEEIVKRVRERFSSRTNLKSAANFTIQIWERMNIHPPGILVTVGSLGLYFLCCLLSFVSVAATSALYYHGTGLQYETKIVEYQGANGQTCAKEQVYIVGKLFKESELTSDRLLYNGKAFSYYPDGTLSLEGAWYQGRWDDEWKHYDPNGQLTRVDVFDKGSFIEAWQSENGRWLKKNLDELPPSLQDMIQTHVNGLPVGPNTPKINQDIISVEEPNSAAQEK